MFNVTHVTKCNENVVFIIHFDDFITKEKHVVVSYNKIMNFFINFRFDIFR